MSPALNGSSAIRRFERSDAIAICDGITFDFYMGLPHVCVGKGACEKEEGEKEEGEKEEGEDKFM